MAAAFPVVYGLYRSRLHGTGAFVATVAGILGGLLWFPPPGFSRGILLIAFLVAGSAPVVAGFIMERLRPAKAAA
ncbi:MAG: hypothetical protein GF398_02645 [Chitinivibrionales bacterium]|nr:hypothetical protein [Chitinivibrionales bacterium]